jgi:hypothetical protein
LLLTSGVTVTWAHKIISTPHIELVFKISDISEIIHTCDKEQSDTDSSDSSDSDEELSDTEISDSDDEEQSDMEIYDYDEERP